MIRRGKGADLNPQPYKYYTSDPKEDIILLQKRIGWHLLLQCMGHRCPNVLKVQPIELYDEYDDVDDFPWHEDAWQEWNSFDKNDHDRDFNFIKEICSLADGYW